MDMGFDVAVSKMHKIIDGTRFDMPFILVQLTTIVQNNNIYNLKK